MPHPDELPPRPAPPDAAEAPPGVGFPPAAPRPATAWLLGILAFVSLLFTTALFVQRIAGWPRSATISMIPSRLQDGPGDTALFEIPPKHRSNLAATQAMVFEDGKPLGPRVPSNKEVAAARMGRFHASKKTVVFSASDESRPDRNGRRYQLVLPDAVRDRTLVHALAATLVLVGLAVRNERIRSAALRRLHPPGPPHPLRWLVAVFLAVFLWRLALLVAYPLPSIGSFLVKGMPMSDALAWNELATSLAEGRGLAAWDGAQRPFYGVMLGFVYLFTGPSLVAAKCINIAAGALVAGLIAMMLRLAAGRWAALAIAAYLLWTPNAMAQVHQTMTEQTGAWFLAAALCGLWAAALRPGWKLAAAAGVLIGFSNLAVPFTVFSVPLLAAATLAEAWFAKIRPTRPSWLVALVFVAAFGACLTPWILRQGMKHGIFSISSNTAELLVASTASDGTKLDVQVVRNLQDNHQVDTRTSAARYHDLMQRFTASVKADPVAYLRIYRRAASHAVDGLHFRRPTCRGMLAAFLLGVGVLAALRTRSWVPWAAACGVSLFLAADAGATGWIVMALAIPLWWAPAPRAERLLSVHLWALLAGLVMGLGLLAGSLVGRSSTMVEWTTFALALVVGRRLLLWIADLPVWWARRHQPPDESAAAATPVVPVPAGAVWATLALGLVATVTMVGVTLAGPRVGWTGRQLDPAHREAILAWGRDLVSRAPGEPGVPALEKLELGFLTPFRVHLAPGEEVHHPFGNFSRRRFDRTVIVGRMLGLGPGGTGFRMLTVPGDGRALPHDRLYAVLMRMPDYARIRGKQGRAHNPLVCALIPFDELAAFPSCPGMVTFDWTAASQ